MIHFFKKSKKIRVRVAAIIKNQSGKILLIKQKKKNHSYWLLPGGGVEFGEELITSLSRELKEELSLEIQNPKFLFLNESISPRKDFHIIQPVFSAEMKDDNISIPNEEKSVLEFKFFTIEEVLNLEIRPDIKSYFQNLNQAESLFLKSKWIED